MMRVLSVRTALVALDGNKVEQINLLLAAVTRLRLRKADVVWASPTRMPLVPLKELNPSFTL